MLFVHTLGEVGRSATTSELLADRMNSHEHMPQTCEHELWIYDGPSFPIKCKGKNWITLVTPLVFLKKDNQAFVGHVWINLNEEYNLDLVNMGRKIGMGDQTVYNQETKKLIQQRYGS